MSTSSSTLSINDMVSHNKLNTFIDMSIEQNNNGNQLQSEKNKVVAAASRKRKCNSSIVIVN